MKPHIYQYISSIVSNKALLRLASKTAESAKIIIDLEDSVYDPNSCKRTKYLKDIGRTNLYKLFIDNPYLKFGVRINSINSNDFNLDILLLNKLKSVEWDFIILPKVDSYDLLERYIVALEKIIYKEIIIIIESKKGVKNISSILTGNISNKISKVHFGHYDYFLDSTTFPIPNQTNTEFWKISEQLISIVESNGYLYIHSPINKLNDPSLISEIYYKLGKICTSNFGMTSISYGQTMQMQNIHSSSYNELILKDPKFNKKTYAENLILQFDKYRNRKFSFSRDYEDGIFITPHDYHAARNFLSNYEKSN